MAGKSRCDNAGHVHSLSGLSRWRRLPTLLIPILQVHANGPSCEGDETKTRVLVSCTRTPVLHPELPSVARYPSLHICELIVDADPTFN